VQAKRELGVSAVHGTNLMKIINEELTPSPKKRIIKNKGQFEYGRRHSVDFRHSSRQSVETSPRD
jgi:hypothetical protein